MLVKSSQSRAHDRRGTTLQEMLVVMAILVSLAGTGWPALRGGLEKARIRDGAKQVRTELAKARLSAIETGVAHAFRFQADNGRFEVAPLSRGSNDNELVDLGESDQEGEKSLETVELKLPEGVVFGEKAPTDADLADDAEIEAIVADEDSTDLTDARWSTPIVFQPNGRTSNARIALRNETGHFIEITLRGLTGAATIGDLKRDEVEQ